MVFLKDITIFKFVNLCFSYADKSWTFIIELFILVGN